MNGIVNFATNCIKNNLSVIPVRPGTKKAAIKWEPYQKRTMNTGEVGKLFVNGSQVALVAGSVSGNLECLDFDKPDLFRPFLDTLESVNTELRTKLCVWQQTPSGGYHLLLRCSAPVSGNLKLAMSAPYQDDRGTRKQDVFIETRGEGGYFLVSPSKGYTLHGKLSEIPIINPDELELLHGIARSFDENHQKRSVPTRDDFTTGDRPGDKFNRANDWSQLLEAEGWTHIKTIGDHQHWCRPGKSDGSTSATLNGQGLFCFSSSTPLPVQKPLDKFAFYTYYRFCGDFTAAARSLCEFRTVPDKSGHSGQNRTFPDYPGHSPDALRTPAGQSPDKTRTLSQEVLAFIEAEPLPFETKDLYSELCVRERREKKTVSDALAYYEKQGKIKKIPNRRGHWEVVENEPEAMDLLAASAEPFKILLPLDISEYARVRPGSIILVSGSNNAGKTVFLLSVVRNFFNHHTYTHTPSSISNEIRDSAPMTYLNSEMSAGELVARIKGFGDEPSSWVPHVKFIERAHSFDKLVEPDGLTFIDYLEVNADFFEAGKLLADIHRRLKGGVAMVAMQKKQGHAFAKGGEMTMEKPRLALNLDKNEPHGFVCKITKAKEPVDYMRTIQGMERDFVITGRSEILPVSDWRFVNENQRRQINAEYARTSLPDRVKRDRIDYRTGQPLFTAPVNEFAEEGAL